MTGPLGFGLAPYGTSIFGYGSVATATVDNTPIYQRADGTQGTARLIDPVTRDYVLTEQGRFVGIDEVEQAVYLALVTLKGSSILPNLGVDFADIKVIGPNIKAKVEDQVNQALADLINADLVQLESVDVEANKGRLIVTVVWRDVSSDSLKETTVNA